MESIYSKYLGLLAKKKEIDEQIENTQCTLYETHQNVLNSAPSLGVVHIEDKANGFKLSVTKRETIKVDESLAAVVGIGFRKKFSLDKAAYNKLSNSDKRRVNECLTTTPAKPSFKVEAL